MGCFASRREDPRVDVRSLCSFTDQRLIGSPAGGGMKNKVQNKTASLAVGAGVLAVLAGALAFRAAGRIGVTDPSVRVVPQTVRGDRNARRNTRYLKVEQAM